VTHIKTLVNSTINNCDKTGCGECTLSCQTASKTSSAVSNQKCENTEAQNAR
jgi:predicted ribosomally synthesized six-cysteine peptide SCIFF